MHWPISPVISVAFVGMMLAAGCQNANGLLPGKPAVAPQRVDGRIHLQPESMQYVQVLVATQNSGRIPLRAPARVAFRDGAVSRLGVPVPARVSAVHVALGEEVSRGTALVTLASAEAASTRANVDRGRLEVRAAQE